MIYLLSPVKKFSGLFQLMNIKLMLKPPTEISASYVNLNGDNLNLNFKMTEKKFLINQ